MQHRKNHIAPTPQRPQRIRIDTINNLPPNLTPRHLKRGCHRLRTLQRNLPLRIGSAAQHQNTNC